MVVVVGVASAGGGRRAGGGGGGVGVAIFFSRLAGRALFSLNPPRCLQGFHIHLPRLRWRRQTIFQSAGLFEIWKYHFFSKISSFSYFSSLSVMYSNAIKNREGSESAIFLATGYRLLMKESQ